MSLILEALKKSERERQLGELPSLSTPTMPLRRRRSILPWLVLLILIAAVVWWFKRPASEPAPSAPATEAVIAAPAEVAAVPVVEPAAAPPAGKITEAAQGGLVHDTRPRESATVAAVVPAPVDSATAAKIAAEKADGEAERKAEAVKIAAAETQKEAAAAAISAAPAAAPAPAPALAADPPLMWELPYAVRKDLPEIKLTMHVHADNPVNRFIIVNDERLAEGEDLEGLRVIEIRGDGIVFEYSGQRFLYPRSGR